MMNADFGFDSQPDRLPILSGTGDEASAPPITQLETDMADLQSAREDTRRQLVEQAQVLRSRMDSHDTAVASTALNPPSAGGATIAGRVVDQASGSPIPGLRFRLVDAAGAPVVETPGRPSDRTGRFSIDVPTEVFKAGELHLEILDREGNSVRRMEQPLRSGSLAGLDVAISVPSDGPLASQAALGRETVALAAEHHTLLATQAAELGARERIAGIYFDRAIAETHAALQELKSAVPPTWSPWATDLGGNNDPNSGPSP